MKIDRIILHQLSMPMVTPFETSFGRSVNRECVLVEVHSEGLVGWGECPADADPGYSYETTTTAVHILKDFIGPSVLDSWIETPQDLPDRIDFVRGHPMAKAGLEMALWDLHGLRLGRPLIELLGGDRSKVPVGVSVGLQESPKALIKVVEGYLKDGYQRVKIKIKPGRDREDTQAIRSAFPDLPLQVDANSAYTLDTAERLQPLDALNLLLIEQPLAEDDLWDHSQLQKRFRTPLCLDESITSPRHARQALEMDACRVINIKQGRVGGLTNSLIIHDLCQGLNIPVWCGGMLETGVGRAANLALAALPNFKLPGDISATRRYYLRDITEEIFELNPDSTMTVPRKPGLGVRINRAALADFSLFQVEISN